MSTFWKSTPKYWCKHCSAYVKDTKFEKSQHEATGKHQGNLRRFLRGIQDGQERDEQEKQKAKAEVDRLNKVIGASAFTSNQHGPSTRKTTTSTSISQLSVADRKKQLAQLVEMGVAIPDEFRGDMALAGDWKVMSQRPIDESRQEEQLNIGVRKRKFEGQEEEEEAGETVVRRGWGSTLKRFPGDGQTDATSIDALLSGVTAVKKEMPTPDIKDEQAAMNSARDNALSSDSTPPSLKAAAETTPVKKEEPTEQSESLLPPLLETPAATGVPDVVFKRRKPKSVKSK